MVDRLVNSEANAERITNVENCFGKYGQPLKVPGRVLVGEGVLTKVCRKKPKVRQFFLFNDILVYGSIVFNKKMYTNQHIIPLEDVKLESIKDDGNLTNGWLIRTSTKSFAVYAPTANCKEEWMTYIDKSIKDLLRKSGKKANDVHAAVWVPDSEATTCMHCKKSHFTVINRRHHCRKCGAVVCRSCSNKRFLLPAQSSKPLRVCLSCYCSLTGADRKSNAENLYNANSATGSSNNSGGSNNMHPVVGGNGVGDRMNANLSNNESSGEEDSDDDDNNTSFRNIQQNFEQNTKFYEDAKK